MSVWVPLSIRHGPWWVRLIWRATAWTTWKPLWRLRPVRWLALQTGEFRRRHT